MRSLDSGFTLVELIVVLIILGIIGGISIVAFGNSHKNSVRSACRTSYQATLLGIQGHQADQDGALPTSLTDLAPTYINPGLIDNSNFILALQKLPGISDNISLLVATTKGTLTRSAELISADATSYTFKLLDPNGLTNGMRVLGTGMSSLFATQASSAQASATLNLEDTLGVRAGMSVIGAGIPDSATVVSVDSASQITISGLTTLALSSSGVVFGALPQISNVVVSTGFVTVTQTNSQFAPISLPNIGGKYSLTFTSGASSIGSLLPGIAPAACEKL